MLRLQLILSSGIEPDSWVLCSTPPPVSSYPEEATVLLIWPGWNSRAVITDARTKAQVPAALPDFVLELLSPTDDLRTVQAKMQEYLNSGAQLGWLINPEAGQVEIYRPGQAVEILNTPTTLSGEAVLPEFGLNLQWLWQ